MTSGSLCVLQSTFILCYSQPAFRPPFGCLLHILFASSEFKYSSRGQGTTYRDYYLALSQSLPVDRHNKAKIFPLDVGDDFRQQQAHVSRGLIRITAGKRAIGAAQRRAENSGVWTNCLPDRTRRQTNGLPYRRQRWTNNLVCKEGEGR